MFRNHRTFMVKYNFFLFILYYNTLITNLTVKSVNNNIYLSTIISYFYYRKVLLIKMLHLKNELFSALKFDCFMLTMPNDTEH